MNALFPVGLLIGRMATCALERHEVSDAHKAAIKAIVQELLFLKDTNKKLKQIIVKCC